MINMIFEFLFWISVLVLFYTYSGYPFLLWIISRLFAKPVKKEYLTLRVSVVVVVHNEEKYIGGKIENILGLDYPRDNLEVIIGSDGSTDNTNKIIEGYKDRGIKSYFSVRQVGKVNVLNKIVPQAEGEIVVFSDARQKFEKGVVRELVANFSDPAVGCVSGELIFRGEDDSGVAKGVGFYWKYEKWMRSRESSLHSMLGATGAIYAIRKRLFVGPPPDTILDDVFIPLKIVEQGYRAVFDSEAIAYDQARKVRTLAGNYQMFIQFKNLFNPFKSKIAIQIFSHKLLRVLAPFFLIFMFVTNLFLLGQYIYNLLFILQVAFYSLALAGWLFKAGKGILGIPYTFCLLNISALIGLFRFITNRQGVDWQKAKNKISGL